MPIYKTTYFFYVQAQGFSENWYIGAANLQAADAVANGQMRTNRQALLGNSTYVQAVRTVDLSAPGSNLLTIYDDAPGGLNNLLNRDNASNAIQVRVTAAGNYRRVMWLRAVPDSWINIDVYGNPVPSPLAQRAVTTFLQAAGAQGVGLRVISNNQAQNPPITITNVTVPNAAPLNIVFSTLTAHGYAVNQYVRINRIQGDNLRAPPPLNYSLNGIWQVTAVPTATSFSITALASDWTGNGGPAPVYFCGGVVRSRYRVDNVPGGTGMLPTITGGFVIRFSRRKPGRAFFVPPGRQRGQRKW